MEFNNKQTYNQINDNGLYKDIQDKSIALYNLIVKHGGIAPDCQIDAENIPENPENWGGIIYSNNNPYKKETKYPFDLLELRFNDGNSVKIVPEMYKEEFIKLNNMKQNLKEDRKNMGYLNEGSNIYGSIEPENAWWAKTFIPYERIPQAIRKFINRKKSYIGAGDPEMKLYAQLANGYKKNVSYNELAEVATGRMAHLLKKYKDDFRTIAQEINGRNQADKKISQMDDITETAQTITPEQTNQIKQFNYEANFIKQIQNFIITNKLGEIGRADGVLGKKTFSILMPILQEYIKNKQIAQRQAAARQTKADLEQVPPAPQGQAQTQAQMDAQYGKPATNLTAPLEESIDKSFNSFFNRINNATILK